MCSRDGVCICRMRNFTNEERIPCHSIHRIDWHSMAFQGHPKISTTKRRRWPTEQASTHSRGEQQVLKSGASCCLKAPADYQQVIFSANLLRAHFEYSLVPRRAKCAQETACALVECTASEMKNLVYFACVMLSVLNCWFSWGRVTSLPPIEINWVVPRKFACEKLVTGADDSSKSSWHR